MQHWAQNPTFPSRESEPADPIAEMTRIRISSALAKDESTNLDGTIEEILHKSLEEDPTSWSESTRKIMRGVVEGLRDTEDAEERIRQASETAVLTVARRWGNVVSAGKATVLGTREAAQKSGLNSASAALQASLGAMEGVRRVGPVAYPILQRELEPIVEDFEAAIEKERSRERSPQSAELPIVVPADSFLEPVSDGPAVVEVAEPPAPAPPSAAVESPTVLVPVVEEPAPAPAARKLSLWQKVKRFFGMKV